MILEKLVFPNIFSQSCIWMHWMSVESTGNIGKTWDAPKNIQTNQSGRSMESIGLRLIYMCIYIYVYLFCTCQVDHWMFANGSTRLESQLPSFCHRLSQDIGSEEKGVNARSMSPLQGLDRRWQKWPRQVTWSCTHFHVAELGSAWKCQWNHGSFTSFSEWSWTFLLLNLSDEL